jgi:long-chain acyl-CoA synthetase
MFASKLGTVSNFQNPGNRSLSPISRPDKMTCVKLTVPADAPNYPTILHALEDVARRTPHRQALICEDRSLTFAQHKQAISGFAGRLQKIGAEGERVAILMANCLEMPVCILAAMAARAYVVPMNPNYSDSEMTPLLKDADPKIIVTRPEFYARLS